MTKLFMLYLFVSGTSVAACFFKDSLLKVFSIFILTIVFIPQNFVNTLYLESGLSSQGLHPAFFCGIIYFLLMTIQKRKEYSFEPILFGFKLIIFFLPTLSTLFLRPPSELLGLFSNLYLAFFAFIAVMHMNHQNVEIISFRLFPTLMYIQVFVSVFQFIGIQLPIYSELPFNISQDQNNIRFHRSTGTFDHPLILGLFLLALLAIYSSRDLKKNHIIPFTFIAVGTVLTQSRGFTVLFSLLILFIFFSTSGSRPRVIIYIPLFLILSLGLAQSFLARGIKSRYSNDYDSITYRTQALSYVYNHLEIFSWFGKGYGSSFELQLSGYIRSSIESGWLMLAIDFGLLWIGCFVFIVVIKMKALVFRMRVAFFILVISTMTFSSVAAPGPCMFILALTMALISQRGQSSIRS